jgi:rubredoxin
MAQSRKCPKCAGAMSAGFIVDETHGGAAVASWVEGEPKRSIWVGLKLRGTTPIEVTTWRCRGCGYLESFAPVSGSP